MLHGARVGVAGVRLFNALSAAIWFRVGGREPQGEQECSSFGLEPWLTVRSHVGVGEGSLRVLATIRVELPVHVLAVSPRELNGTTAPKRGIPLGARGGIQILGMVSALTAVVDVAAFSSAEKQELVALVQSRQASDVDDSELSAPAAAVYVSHSSDFVDVLNDLLDKAQTLLDVTRHAESNAVHNFAVLKHSFEDQLTQDNTALTKAKADNSEFASSLEAERADLAEPEKSLGGC